MRKLTILISLLLAVSIAQAQESPTCPGFLPSRLTVGQSARVTPGDANNVRSEPSGSSARIGQIPGGAVFTVLEGPQCAADTAWWKVDYEGLIGWTVEGMGADYWLEPIAPVENTITAENLARLTPREIGFSDVNWFDWSADGRWMVVAENDGPWVKDTTTTEADARLAVRWRDLENLFSRYQAAFYRQGMLLAYSILRHGIHTFDLMTGENQVFVETPDYPLRIAFSPDGSLLATASSEGLRVWDVTTRAQRFEHLQDTDSVPTMAFSTDSTLLAYAPEEHEILVLDVQTGVLQKTLHVHEYGYGYNEFESILNIAFSPDGTRLAAATYKRIILWDISTGRKLAVLPGANRVAFSPDGKLLVTGYYDSLNWDRRSHLLVYEATTGVQLGFFAVHEASVGAIAFNPNGTRLYTANSERSGYGAASSMALEWTLSDQDEDYFTVSPPVENECPGFLPVRLETGGQARVLPNLAAANLRVQPSMTGAALQQIPGGEVVQVLDGPQCTLGAAWWQVDYNGAVGWIAEGQADSYLLQPYGIVPETPQYTGDPQALLGTGTVTGMAVSPDGSTLAVISTPGIWLYDLADLEAAPRLLYRGDARINTIAFSPDSSLLAVGTGSYSREKGENLCMTWVWEVDTGTVQTQIDHEASVMALTFSPDGRLLAIGAYQAMLWDVAEGYERGIFGYDIGINEFIFSPNGRVLIGSRNGYSAEIWDVASGKLTASVYDAPLCSVDCMTYAFNPALSPDGLILATDGAGLIQLWNGVTGVMQSELFTVGEGSEHSIYDDMAFSPDGTLLMSAGDKLRLWDMTFQSVTVLQAEMDLDLFNGPHTVAFSPDGTRMVVGDNGATIVWTVEPFEQIAALSGGHGLFCPDNRVITFDDKAAYVWDSTGSLIAALPG